MDPLYAFRVFLVSVALGGIVYACLNSGLLSGDQTNWWGELPKHKKIAFGAGITATILQTFI
ncbi:MAG: hypothetical protein GY723_02550 [bacterium]|nr:hypothetical protein [bacterium]MCP5069102.1 hypothetical protein [bacterium]